MRDEWQQLYAHDAGGNATAGSIDTLEEAFVKGAEIKVAIEGLCADLAGASDPAVRHELFVHCGPGYFETDSRCFAAGAQPTVRIRPAIPLWCQSRAGMHRLEVHVLTLPNTVAPQGRRNK